MKKFITLGITGIVEKVGTGRSVPVDAIEVEPSIPDADYFGLMQDEFGDLVSRPQSPPVIDTGTGYAILDCPEGTVIEVHDLLGREVMANITAPADSHAVEFTLPDPGEYEVTVQAPSPHIVTTKRIAV